MKRSPLKHTGFARRQYVAPPPAPVRPLDRLPNYSAANDAEPVQKGPKAKPGKRQPTAVERLWLDRIVSYGCIACRIDGHAPRPTAVHHILRGGVRMGHLFSIGLCDPGHHQGGEPLGLVSRHPFKARFEARYGSEWDLLATLKREVGGFDEWRTA